MSRLPVIDLATLEPKPTLLYLELSEQIRDFIARCGDASLLPTERALASAYGVSRITVRKAIGRLKAEGLVASAQGRGNFITRRH